MDEIRRLQEEFQRAQQSTSVSRLSERSVVEIVMKLTELSLIDVLFTADGKEYITPSHLQKEVRDELYVRGGRIALVELPHLLNVDLTHIEARVQGIIAAEPHIQLVAGELIESRYLDGVAQEINEYLQAIGQITVADMCKRFNLPVELLQLEIERRLGSQIHGQLDAQDRGVVFTQAFVARQTAAIRGAFTGITRPTPVSQVLSAYKFPERIFYVVVARLVETKQLAGSLQGRNERAVYFPDVFSRTQHHFAEQFFAQNNYIDHDTLKRIEISDPRTFCATQLSNAVPLVSVHVNQSVIDHVNNSIVELVETAAQSPKDAFLDISPLIPAPCSVADATVILEKCSSLSENSDTLRVLADTFAVSKHFLEFCSGLLTKFLDGKAHHAPSILALAAPSTHVLEGAEDDASAVPATIINTGKKAPAASAPSAKGKGKRGAAASSTAGKATGDAAAVSEPFDEAEVLIQLQLNLRHCEDALLEQVAHALMPSLLAQYHEFLKQVFIVKTAELEAQQQQQQQQHQHHHQQQQSSSSVDTHTPSAGALGDFDSVLQSTLQHIRLFEAGIRYFDAAAAGILSKHLLKTHCTELVNLITLRAAGKPFDAEAAAALTPEARAALAKSASPAAQTALKRLNETLNGSSVPAFLENIAEAAEACEYFIKKQDKRGSVRRQVAAEYLAVLEQRLRAADDPALVLHLAVVILFSHTAQALLHAPGRAVPQIITWLGKHLQGMPDTAAASVAEASKKGDDTRGKKRDKKNADREEASSAAASGSDAAAAPPAGFRLSKDDYANVLAYQKLVIDLIKSEGSSEGKTSAGIIRNDLMSGMQAIKELAPPSSQLEWSD